MGAECIPGMTLGQILWTPFSPFAPEIWLLLLVSILVFMVAFYFAEVPLRALCVEPGQARRLGVRGDTPVALSPYTANSFQLN